MYTMQDLLYMCIYRDAGYCMQQVCMATVVLNIYGLLGACTHKISTKRPDNKYYTQQL